MTKATGIRLADARRAFRLLGEIRELGHDPVAWRLRLLQGLTAILGAQVGLTGEMDLPYTLNHTRPANPVDFGWAGERERRSWHAYFSRLDISDDPTWHEIYPHRGYPFTRCRDQFLSTSQWYRSEHVQRFRRASGVDSFVMSQRPLTWLRRDHLIYIFRAWNDKPLEARQCRMLVFFHDELAIMLKRDAEKSGTDPRLAAFGPRLRQTLSLLLAGDSEMAIAKHLSLSRHTVHQYVKGLYCRLDVSSRAQLLAMRHRVLPATGLLLDIPGCPRIPAACRPLGAATPFGAAER